MRRMTFEDEFDFMEGAYNYMPRAHSWLKPLAHDETSPFAAFFGGTIPGGRVIIRIEVVVIPE